MFLLLSKIVFILISPANWLLLLFAWWLFTKSLRLRKILAITMAVLIVVFGNDFLFTKLVVKWQPKPVQLHEAYEAGILLGGAGSFDKDGNGYLNNACDRVMTTATLYKTGVIKKVVITAGHFDKTRPSEALYLSQRLTALGIPAADIITEGRSRSTFENAAYTRSKMDSMQLKPPYVLITSAMHMRRAMHTFQKAQLNVVAYPCNYEVVDKKFAWSDCVFPSPYVIVAWNGFLKEMVGLAGYSLFGRA